MLVQFLGQVNNSMRGVEADLSFLIHLSCKNIYDICLCLGVKIIIVAYSRQTSYLVCYKSIFINNKVDSDDILLKITNLGEMRD